MAVTHAVQQDVAVAGQIRRLINHQAQPGGRMQPSCTLQCHSSCAPGGGGVVGAARLAVARGAQRALAAEAAL